MKAQGGGVCKLYYFFNLHARWVGGQSHTLAALTPGKRPNIHWIRGCVHPRVIMDRKWTLALTRFQTLDIQPFVNHYTTCTIPATTSRMNMELQTSAS